MGFGVIGPVREQRTERDRGDWGGVSVRVIEFVSLKSIECEKTGFVWCDAYSIRTPSFVITAMDTRLVS